MKFSSAIAIVLLFLSNTLFAQGNLTSGAPWAPASKTNIRLIPATNGGLWVVDVDIDVDPDLSAIYLVRLDGNGNKLFQRTYKTGKEIGKYNICGLVGEGATFRMILSQEDKSTGEVILFQSLINEQGDPASMEKVWSFKPDHKIAWEDRNCLVEQSDDKQVLLISSFDGESFAVLDVKGKVQREGGNKERGRMSVVKNVAVSNNGTVAMLYFDNQNSVFQTVNQSVKVHCYYSDNTSRVENATPMSGYLSPTSLDLGFRANGNVVLSVFSVKAMNSSEPANGAITEIIKGSPDVKRKVFDVNATAVPNIGRVEMIGMKSGHLVLIPTLNSELIYEVSSELEVKPVPMSSYSYKGYAIGFFNLIATSDVVYGLLMCDDECFSKKGVGSGKVGRQKQYSLVVNKYLPGQQVAQNIASAKFPEKHIFNYQLDLGYPIAMDGKYILLGLLGSNWTRMVFDPLMP